LKKPLKADCSSLALFVVDGARSCAMSAGENGNGLVATDSHPAARTAQTAESGYFLTAHGMMKRWRWTTWEISKLHGTMSRTLNDPTTYKSKNGKSN
jgi:hypothetical protein